MINKTEDLHFKSLFLNFTENNFDTLIICKFFDHFRAFTNFF